VKREELVFNLFLLAVLVLMLVVNFQYRPRARRIPMMTGLCTLGLLVAVNARTIKNRTRDEFEKQSKSHADDLDAPTQGSNAIYAKKEAVIILWLIGLTALMYLIGFLIAIPLYLFLFLYVFAKETWKVSLGMSVGVFAVIYVIFVKILNVHVHEGLLF
jgi:protein-S-isoprenylcysteine O-methyltransferase Ste14